MSRRKERFARAEFARETADVARRLLGCALVRELDGRRLAGVIVETEAYVGEEDLGCHASRGRTARVEAMYGPPGHAYVYVIYGMHWCLNVVTRAVGEPHAVLIRALEPVDGADVMAERRRSPRTGSVPKTAHLTNGPGKLCHALSIDKDLYGVDLTGDVLWIEPAAPISDEQIAVGPRVGIGYAGAWADTPLRFWIRGNRFVSR